MHSPLELQNDVLAHSPSEVQVASHASVDGLHS
jgi:hypothetical protein